MVRRFALGGCALALCVARPSWAQPAAEASSEAAAALDAESEKFAELDPGTTPAAITVGDAWARYYRVPPGKGFGMSVMGPTSLQLNVRIEGGPPPEPLMVAVSRDGKLLRLHGLQPPPDALDVWSDRGLPVTESAPIVVPIPEGPHAVALGWPPEATGDALVAIEGSVTPVVRASEIGRPEDEEPLTYKTITANADANTEVERTGVPPVLPPPPPKIFASLFVGAARSDESRTAPVGLTRLGIAGAYRVHPLVRVGARLDLRSSEQPYLTNLVDVDGTFARASLDERRTDFTLNAGYDALPWLRERIRHWMGRVPALLEEGRGSLSATGGLRWTSLSNAAFPADLLGLELGARAELQLSPQVGVRAGLGWVYDLLSGDTFSALGSPSWLLGYEAGLAFPLQGGYTLELMYQAELLGLEFDTRSSQGMVLGFQAAF